MMKLSDKDALADAVQGAINIMESHGISMIAASVPLAIIKGAPTVDAIPVEWLSEKAAQAERDIYYCKGDAKRNVEIMRSAIVMKRLWEQEQDG